MLCSVQTAFFFRAAIFPVASLLASCLPLSPHNKLRPRSRFPDLNGFIVTALASPPFMSSLSRLMLLPPCRQFSPLWRRKFLHDNVLNRRRLVSPRLCATLSHHFCPIVSRLMPPIGLLSIDWYSGYVIVASASRRTHAGRPASLYQRRSLSCRHRQHRLIADAKMADIPKAKHYRPSITVLLKTLSGRALTASSRYRRT